MPDYKKDLDKEKQELFKARIGFESVREWMDEEKEDVLSDRWYEGGLQIGSHCIFSREERDRHWHIVGSTQSGKSRLLQLLIQRNLKRGEGCFLIDPAGHLFNRLLTFCKRNKLRKVLVIDPSRMEMLSLGGNVSSFSEQTADPKYLSFNPLIPYPGETIETCARRCAGAVMVGWGGALVEKQTLQFYLPYMFEVLIRLKLNLSEADFFFHTQETSKGPTLGKPGRALLANCPECPATKYLHDLYIQRWQDVHGQIMAGRNRMNFSTNRLMQYILGQSKPSVPLDDLLADGWAIFVNLTAGGWCDTRDPYPRILGSLLFSDVLAPSYKREKPVYVYVDEVADFATDDLGVILQKKLQENVILHLAHQNMAQLDSEKLQMGITGNCDNKLVFNLNEHRDRERFAKDLFFDVSKARSFRNKKQYAVVSKDPEEEAQLVRIKNVTDEAGDFDDYLFSLYAEHKKYYSSGKEVLAQIARRQYPYTHGQTKPEPPDDSLKSKLKPNPFDHL